MLLRKVDVCIVGIHVYAPSILASVKFRDFEKLRSSLVFNNFKLGNFTKLKALFSVVSPNFPQLVHGKSWTKPWKVLYQWKFPFFSVVALFITVPTPSERGLKPFHYNYMLSILLKLPMLRPLWRPLLVISVMSVDWLCRRERSTFRHGTQSNNAL